MIEWIVDKYDRFIYWLAFWSLRRLVKINRSPALAYRLELFLGEWRDREWSKSDPDEYGDWRHSVHCVWSIGEWHD